MIFPVSGCLGSKITRYLKQKVSDRLETIVRVRRTLFCLKTFNPCSRGFFSPRNDSSCANLQRSSSAADISLALISPFRAGPVFLQRSINLNIHVNTHTIFEYSEILHKYQGISSPLNCLVTLLIATFSEVDARHVLGPVQQ